MIGRFPELLNRWDELWRYPRVLAGLDHDPGAFPIDRIVDGLLSGLAANHTPREAVEDLITDLERGFAAMKAAL